MLIILWGGIVSLSLKSSLGRRNKVLEIWSTVSHEKTLISSYKNRLQGMENEPLGHQKCNTFVFFALDVEWNLKEDIREKITSQICMDRITDPSLYK